MFFLSKDSILLLSNESLLHPNNLLSNREACKQVVRNFLTRKLYFNLRLENESISQAELGSAIFDHSDPFIKWRVDNSGGYSEFSF